jgi:ABC-type enterochelin transport system substrate-binding protein
MKKLLVLFALLALTACSTTNTVEQTLTQTVSTGTYSTTRYACNTCQGSSYTVRKPVEIVYENTTYTTVYEPKTYTTVTRERKPYNGCTKNELCK